MRLLSGLALGGIDTAANGPSKVRQVTGTICRNIGAVYKGKDIEPVDKIMTVIDDKILKIKSG